MCFIRCYDDRGNSGPHFHAIDGHLQFWSAQCKGCTGNDYLSSPPLIISPCFILTQLFPASSSKMHSDAYHISLQNAGFSINSQIHTTGSCFKISQVYPSPCGNISMYLYSTHLFLKEGFALSCIWLKVSTIATHRIYLPNTHNRQLQKFISGVLPSLSTEQVPTPPNPQMEPMALSHPMLFWLEQNNSHLFIKELEPVLGNHRPIDYQGASPYESLSHCWPVI